MDSTRQYTEPDTKCDSASSTFDEKLGTLPLTVQLLTSYDIVSSFDSHLKALKQHRLAKQHLDSTNFSAAQPLHTNLIILNDSRIRGWIAYGVYLAIHRTRHQMWFGMNDSWCDFETLTAMIVCQSVVRHLHLKDLQQYHLEEQRLDCTNSSATAMTHQSNYSQQKSNARRVYLLTMRRSQFRKNRQLCTYLTQDRGSSP